MIKNEFPNSKIISVDLEKFHNENVIFKKCNLSVDKDRQKLLDRKYDFLTCTDVFEHLDKSFIDDVISMCSKLSNNCFFAIANHSDIQNGVELHTIQENNTWWESKLTNFFNINMSFHNTFHTLYMYHCDQKLK
jgi:2-polyprenyl-3-methyl-5-hydroxy-6-metoxy-1,4-benzoquinol methylase